MKAFVAAVVLCLLVGSAVAQLPICDPNGTPLPVSNFRMTDNKYDKDSKQTRLTITFDNDTKNKPTAGCVKYFEVMRNVDGKRVETKKVDLGNPRQTPLSVSFMVPAGTTSSFSARGVTAAGKTGLTMGSGPQVAAAGQTGVTGPVMPRGL